MCCLMTMLRSRPQVRRDYPLSLSISISGGIVRSLGTGSLHWRRGRCGLGS
ncbi:hypothetical protein HanHA300_Chr00c0186g0725971 [Helianthus annuus]|nr:hypothetical protein HanHA300_Chr00c0186g0725971 [Helianthus annuus]KAJ0829109.1 hypothetical protein HanLR1_Chr00c0038g0697421 [Helianthus annuus]